MINTACAQCSAKFFVTEDLVAGKVVRFRCRRCGGTITVDGTGLARAGKSSRPPSPREVEGTDAQLHSIPPPAGKPEIEAPTTPLLRHSTLRLVSTERTAPFPLVQPSAIHSEDLLLQEPEPPKRPSVAPQPIVAVPEAPVRRSDPGPDAASPKPLQSPVLGSPEAAPRPSALPPSPRPSRPSASSDSPKTPRGLAGTASAESPKTPRASPSPPPAALNEPASVQINQPPPRAEVAEAAGALPKVSVNLSSVFSAEGAVSKEPDIPVDLDEPAPAPDEPAELELEPEPESKRLEALPVVPKLVKPSVRTPPPPPAGARRMPSKPTLNEAAQSAPIPEPKAPLKAPAPPQEPVVAAASEAAAPVTAAPLTPGKPVRKEDTGRIDLAAVARESAAPLSVPGDSEFFTAAPAAQEIPVEEPWRTSMAPEEELSEAAPAPSRRKGMWLVFGAVGACAAAAAVVGLLYQARPGTQSTEGLAPATSVASSLQPAAEPSPTPSESAAAVAPGASESASAVAAASASAGQVDSTKTARTEKDTTAREPGSKTGTQSDSTGPSSTTKKEEPSTPPPKSTSTQPPAGDQPFDRAAASSSIEGLKGAAAGCKQPDGPQGHARISITFAPTGRVTTAVIDGPPFGGTAVGGCIASTFRRAHVPPFSGPPVTVRTSVGIF